MKKILFIMFLLNISCSSSQSKKTDSNGQCFIIEENFKTSPIRNFLNTTTYKKEIVDLFVKDKNEYAFLSIVGGSIVYASKKGDNFDVTFNDKVQQIKSEIIVEDLKSYCNLNTIYSLQCSDDYKIFDSEQGFVYYWIKEAGTIKFICYNKKGSYYSLNSNDKQKLSLLIKIDDLFRRE